MKPIMWIFFAHVVCLLLASTRFTILTYLYDDVSLHFDFFRISWEYGRGYVYQSRCILPQMLTYVAAYSLGIPVFLHAWRRGRRVLGGLGTLLCVIGLLSFALESSHAVVNHNLSLIASFPLVLYVLWIWWVIQEVWLPSKSRSPRPDVWHDF